MKIRTLVFAAVGSAAMLAGGTAFADSSASSSPPEPYSAPDPVYTPHKVQSDVTMHQKKDTADLSDSGGSSTSTK